MLFILLCAMPILIICVSLLPSQVWGLALSCTGSKFYHWKSAPCWSRQGSLHWNLTTYSIKRTDSNVIPCDGLFWFGFSLSQTILKHLTKSPWYFTAPQRNQHLCMPLLKYFAAFVINNVLAESPESLQKNRQWLL